MPASSDRPARDPGSFSLALGGGGARGLAHVGVLTVLEASGLRPRAIAGTSMGAVAGALFAAGHRPQELRDVVESLKLRELIAAMAPGVLSRGALLSADPIEQRLRELLPATFAELGVPFACVAADLVTGDRAVLTEGDLPLAVRASMSIPAVFEPVRWDGAVLVDGGISEPVPVATARELGGDPVVAVDVGPLVPAAPGTQAGGHKPSFDGTGAVSVAQVGTRSFDVMQHDLALTELGTAAVVIAPDVGGYLMADFMEAQALVDAGESAARRAVGAVRDAVARTRRPGTFRGALRRMFRG